MNQKVLQTLEFDKIINILTGYATTELGKLMCANLKPMTEEADILNAQDQTQDALTRIYKRGNVSFFGVSDLSPSLARLKMRGTLGTGELLDIARVLESVKNAVSYGVRIWRRSGRSARGAAQRGSRCSGWAFCRAWRRMRSFCALRCWAFRLPLCI